MELEAKKSATALFIKRGEQILIGWLHSNNFLVFDKMSRDIQPIETCGEVINFFESSKYLFCMLNEFKI